MASRLFVLTFVLLLVSGINAEYNETIAKRMLPLAAAAYSSNPSDCLASQFVNATLVTSYDFLCDITQNATCAGYIALLHTEKVIALSFRGTNTVIQMLEEVLSALEEKPNFLGIGRVNQYFYEAYTILWTNGMARKLYNLADDYPDYKIWVTGHSLGAAIATLASADLVASGRFNEENSVHYNFGQPRVGDLEFAILHDYLLPQYYRVTHAQDFISGQFLPVLGYSHHATQIWYDNDMTPGSAYIVCPFDADPRCFGPPRLNMEDHRHYFNIKVTHWGESGCPTPVE